MKYSKKRIYFKSYLINHFLYKNIYTEFTVLNNRDGNMCNSNELLLAVRSIPRKPQKSRNPRKFSFPSQTKCSPPIITFAHGVNPYLYIFFFRWVRKENFCQFYWLVVKRESAESTEIFKSWKFFVFLY